MESFTPGEDGVIIVNLTHSPHRERNQTSYNVTGEAEVSTTNFGALYSKPTPVACHFFFPTTQEEIENCEREENQQDPFASSECFDALDCKPENVSVDDELLALENLPTVAATSFSIIDPLNIVELEDPKIKKEPGIEAQDIKPTPSQLEEETRKRKLDCNFSFNETPKKIKLESKPDISNIVLKNLAVNIGPKLPLPYCFQSKSNIDFTSIETTLHQEKIEFDCKTSDGLESVFDCKESDRLKNHEEKHVVLKIFRCSKCNHKCTGLNLHKSHVAVCGAKCSKNNLKSSAHKSIDRNRIFPCKICSFKFEYEENLIVHQSSHCKGKGFYCHVCKDTLPSVIDLNDHYSDLHKGLTKVLSCNVCAYSTMKYQHLRDHMMQHITDKNLYCCKCRRNYEDLDSYDQHLIDVHKNILMKKKSTVRKLIDETTTTPNLQINAVQEKHSTLKSNFKNILMKKKSTVRKSIDETTTTPNLQINAVQEKHSTLKSNFLNEIIKRDGLYSCNGCKYTFSNLENLKRHKEEHLNVSKPYVCASCDYESLSLVDMSHHVQKHSCKLKVSCNVCEMVFKTWYIMKCHAVNHVYDKLYCRKCRSNLEDSVSYQQHMSSVHKESSNVRIYSCSKCSFTHSSIGMFKRHMTKHMYNENKSHLLPDYKIVDQLVHSKKQPSCLNSSTVLPEPSSNEQSKLVKRNHFKCKQCRIVFKSETAFKKHNKIHQEQSFHKITKKKWSENKLDKCMFKCNKCSYECTQVNTLEEHNNVCHVNQQVPFICVLCGSKFTTLSLYVQHVKSHTGNTIYSCCYCQYSCKKVTFFKKHIADHGFKCCPMCIYKTLRFNILKAHIEKHHTAGKGPFVCHVCPFSTLYRKSLCAHYIRFHRKQYDVNNLTLDTQWNKAKRNNSLKPYACQICPYKASRAHDLKRHVIRHLNKILKSGEIFKSKQIKHVLAQSKVQHKLHNMKNVIPTREISRNDMNKGFYYLCSQCNYKKRLRKSVSQHLLKVHNIVGGVRNRMIVKVQDNKGDGVNITGKKDQTILKRKSKEICTDSQMIVKVIDVVQDNKGDEVNITGKKDQTILKRKSKEICTDSQMIMKVIDVVQDNKGDEVNITGKKDQTILKHYKSKEVRTDSFVRCIKCNIHKYSRYAQKDHKKCGHKAFWAKSHSCQKCGMRFTTKCALMRHKLKEEDKFTLFCKKCNNFKTHRKDVLNVHIKRCNGTASFREEETKQANNNSLVTSDLTVNGRSTDLGTEDEHLVCGECDFVTSDITELSMHMFIHSGVPDD